MTSTTKQPLPVVRRVRASNDAVAFINRSREVIPPAGVGVFSSVIVTAAGIFYGGDGAREIGAREMRALVRLIYGDDLAAKFE